MPRISSCPAPDVLQRLTAGLIPDSDAEPLEQHLSTCGRCVDTLHGLKPNDTLSNALRGSEVVLGRLGNEEVRGVVQRLEAMAPSGGGAVLSDAGDKESAALASRLTGYRVMKRIGAGGMGVVYQVENVALGRMEALKVMRPALAENDAARSRFLREARAMAQVKHEHVATVYHVIDDPATPFLTMELLEGETLEDRLQREKRLPVADVLRIGREIAEGLAAAHRHNLIHRDVKPGNIWLEGERKSVKVLDFGLARAADGGDPLTHSGAIVGTPSYMAPEQASGKAVDARCDLFSLGCVLYRMSTGELPFQGQGVYAVLQAVGQHKPPAPRDRNPDLTPELSALVMRLLEKDPAKRPASAPEVVEALQALERRTTAFAPVATVVHAPRPGARKSGRRWRWFAAAAVLLALIPVGVVYEPTVVRIVTNKGVVVIETDDDAVEVTVKGQGATIIDPRTKREIEVRAGDQEIEVTEKRPDGLHFFTKQFMLSRGGTEIVHVREEMAKSGATDKPSAAEPLASEITNSIGMKFRLIRPGKFLMGSPKGEKSRNDDEGPQHEVEITKPFYIGVYPVTKREFAAFVKDDGYQTEAEADGKGGCCNNAANCQWEQKPECTWRHPGFPQTDDHPVVQVTWDDAQAFCRWLSRKEGKVYELPTEAEWEYACRAGTTTRFWCGDTDESLQGDANIGDAALRSKYAWATAAVSWDDGYAYTSPVGIFKANPWGLYDMGGNVWQWCADWYGPYQEGPVSDPKGPQSGQNRVWRGGSWLDAPGACRSANRSHSLPPHRYGCCGFRVVLRPGRVVGPSPTETTDRP